MICAHNFSSVLIRKYSIGTKMTSNEDKIINVQYDSYNKPGICRVCMKKNKNEMNELFGDSKIVNKIQFCTGILLTEYPTLPSLICTECLSQLKTAHIFKTTCIAAEKLFKELVKQEIKTEIIDDEIKVEIENVVKVENEEVTKAPSPVQKVSMESLKPAVVVKHDLKSKNPTKKITSKSLKHTKFVRQDLKSTTVKLKVVCIDDGKGTRAKKEKTPRIRKNCKKPLYFRKLSCMKCNINFQTKEESIEHHEKLHNISKYVCEICGKQFLYQASHHEHIRRIHREGPSYACAHCSYTTKFKADLKIHLTIHTDEKKYHCHICPEMFRTSSNLQAHIRRKHGGKKINCDRCDMSFYDGYTLRRHSTAVHDKIKRHICTVCKKGFSFRKTWKQHLFSQHAVTVPPARPGPRSANSKQTTPVPNKDKII